VLTQHGERGGGCGGRGHLTRRRAGRGGQLQLLTLAPHGPRLLGHQRQLGVQALGVPLGVLDVEGAARRPVSRQLGFAARHLVQQTLVQLAQVADQLLAVDWVGRRLRITPSM